MAKTEKDPKPAETESAPAAAGPPAPPVAPLPVGGTTIAQGFTPPPVPPAFRRGPEDFNPSVFDARPQLQQRSPEFDFVGQQQASSERPRAVVTENADGLRFRPPPGVGLALLGDVVIHNWHGQVEGKSVRVRHGTPARDLPDAVIEAILSTPDMKIGPFNPNPQPQAEPGRR